jgi:phosphatidate cytidylyltransferase
LNKSELLTRSLTGFFIVSITLAAIIFSPYTYLLLLAFITFYGTYELLKLLKAEFTQIHFFLFALILTALVCFSGWWIMQGRNPVLLMVAIPVMVSVLVLVNLVQSQLPADMVQKSQSSYLAAVYVCLPMISGCLFFLPEYSFKFVLVPIILIWVNDVGAYLVGSMWGSKKIKPEISPGKSIQGTLGGLVITFLAGLILIALWPDISRGYTIVVSLATPFFALGGDLWESSLKRDAGVKDSGHFFPGHGGILDRYDSFLFVLPVAALAYFIFVL